MSTHYKIILISALIILSNSILKATVVSGTSGSFNHMYYSDNETLVWDINTTVNYKPVKIILNLGSEEEYDFIKIYAIDEYGHEVLIDCSSGTNITKTLSTLLPTGKARIVFTSDGSTSYSSSSAYWGFYINFFVDNTTTSIGDLSVNGSINGNLAGNALRIQTTYGNLDLGPQSSGWANINTNQPNFLFNKTLYTSSNAYSSYSNGDLKLQTNGTTRMILMNSSGNVGINNTSPSERLTIHDGEIGVYSGQNSNNSIHNGIKFWTDNPPYYAAIRANRYNYSNMTGLSFFTANNAIPKEVMRINYNGNVGIGTSSPDELLTVKGTIHAKEVKIDLNGDLADFVFDSNYNLKSLKELESYIEYNKHLPDLPSAKEVKEKGMNMGEMQNKLLQKIEELTLYVIKLEKTNEMQNAEIQTLKSQLNPLVNQ